MRGGAARLPFSGAGTTQAMASTRAVARTEEAAFRRIKVICPTAKGIDNEVEFHVPLKKLQKKTPWLALSAINALKKKAGADGPQVDAEAKVWLQRTSGERIEPTAPVADITDGATVRVRWRNSSGSLVAGDGSSKAPSKWDFSFREDTAQRRMDGNLSTCYYPQPTNLYPDRKPLVHSPYSKSLYYYLEREANEKEYHGELTELEAFLYAKAKHQAYMMRVCEVDAEKQEKQLFEARADHKKTKKRLDKQNAELDAYRKKLAEQKIVRKGRVATPPPCLARARLATRAAPPQEIELYQKTILSARAEAAEKNALALDRAQAPAPVGAE